MKTSQAQSYQQLHLMTFQQSSNGRIVSLRQDLNSTMNTIDQNRIREEDLATKFTDGCRRLGQEVGQSITEVTSQCSTALIQMTSMEEIVTERRASSTLSRVY